MDILIAAMLAGAIAPPTLEYQFEIRRAEGTQYNPWTLEDDKVQLRSFVGSGAQAGDFVAPVIRVAPGQRLAIAIDNQLEPCSEKQRAQHACFNDTNLHTHGLWVSPVGNSDNVLIAIKPGEQFRYVYDLPADHPAGTFWYHPHRHGSGFVQVGSGMAGALIVTGNRLPSATSPGDVDILLKDEHDRPFTERVLVFQQIQYGCLDAKGQIEGRLDERRDYIRPFTCGRGGVGRLESFDHDWDWRWSGRFTGINGKIQPALAVARTGSFERWRLIHAGTRESIRMRLYKLDQQAPSLRTVKGVDQAQWIQSYCTGEPLPLWQVAMDGLTRSVVRRTDEAVLFPGDRIDVLARMPKAGSYCMVHDTSRSKNGENPSRVVAVVEARGGEASGEPDALLQAILVSAAERALAGTPAIRERVVGELRSGMKLTSFVPHRHIPEEEISGYREALVNIVETPTRALFRINARDYDHDRVDQVLPLGKAEEWRAISLLGNHPLHIHVNPFEIISITDSAGQDVTDPKSPVFDSDYAGLKGEWKDTVMLKQDLRVVFRTRYERYAGDFVTHCHIMFHGDHGMMQNLRIAAEGEPDRPFGHPEH